MATKLEALKAYEQQLINTINNMTESDIKYSEVQRPDGIMLKRNLNDFLRELNRLEEEIAIVEGESNYGQMPEISNGYLGPV